MKRNMVIFVLLIFWAGTADADLYKWVDENGVTHYSNTPVITKKDKDVKVYKEANDNRRTPQKYKTKRTSSKKAEDVTQIIRNNCIKEWDDNYRMVEFCIKQQNSAVNWLARNQNQIPKEIYSRCLSEWNHNYRMVKFCIEKQTDAKKSLGLK